MKALDIIVDSLPTDVYEKIEPQIVKEHEKKVVLPLISSDLFFESFHRNIESNAIEQEIKALKKVSKSFFWQNDFDKILKENDFESLVVTDNSKKIIWVNNGFTKMTGYSKKYVIDKTPDFLQGKNTSLNSRKIIRTNLNSGKPFKATVLNYKKDMSTYKCELHIFPLFNIDQEITHYLALEKQVA